jgi:hypothetical protein
MTFPISNKHPLPTERTTIRHGRKGDGRQEAIMALEVGQSFFLGSTMNSVSSLRWWATSKFPEREFTARKEGSGVRIWRTK